MPSGGGRRRGFDGRLERVGISNEVLTAVAGIKGNENEDLWAGAEGGSDRPGGRRAIGRAVRPAAICGLNGPDGGSNSVAESPLASSSVGSALELRAPRLNPSKSRVTPRSSRSSSSSIRSSVKTLLLVTTLAAEPFRLREGPYLERHAGPMPSPCPVPAEPIEDEDPFRAMIRSSMA